jgi:hypothetical protein
VSFLGAVNREQRACRSAHGSVSQDWERGGLRAWAALWWLKLQGVTVTLLACGKAALGGSVTACEGSAVVVLWLLRPSVISAATLFARTTRPMVLL